MAPLKFDVDEEVAEAGLIEVPLAGAPLAAPAVAVTGPSPGLSLARAQLAAPVPSVEPVLALLGAAALFAAGAVLLATAVVMGPPDLNHGVRPAAAAPVLPAVAPSAATPRKRG